MRTHGSEQQAAIGYISSTTLNEDGLRVRNKKKRKTKSLPNSNSPSNNANSQSQNSSFGFDDLSIKESFLALLQLQNRPYGDFNFDSADSQAVANFYSQLPKPLNQLNPLSLSGSMKHLQQLNSKDSKLMLNDDLDESEHRSTASSDEQQENLLNKNGSYHDDELNKLAFKRSLTQNSTLYNTLLNSSLTAAASAINGNSSNANSKSDLADINSILSVISSVTPMLQNVTSDLQHLPLNDEQMAKLNQTLHQQALQDQSALLNNNSLTPASLAAGKQAGKRPRSNQINGSARALTNGTSNGGKRVKRESKNSDFGDDLSSLTNLNNLNSLTNLSNLTNSLNNLKNNTMNNSLNSINNLLNDQAEDDRKSDQGSDKSVKNGSDIENEMANGKLNNGKQSTDKTSSKLNNSSATSQSQSLLNNSQPILEPTLEHDDTMEDEDDEVNLSEEEEANKLEQELCEQIKKEEKKAKIDEENEANKSVRSDAEMDDDRKDDLQKSSDDLFKNDLNSLIVTKKSSGISENLADLLIKSDKNNNKNMRNNNGSSNELSQRVFIDPMVEDDVKLLERQLQDQQYLCKICHLEVRSVNTLRRHQRLHDAGGQLYACHYCTYTSLDKSSLIRHLRTHNGERP